MTHSPALDTHLDSIYQERGFDQVPSHFPVDDLKSAIARPPWERLLIIFHGIAFHRELVTQSTIANGLYRRADKGTGYNEHYLRLTSARRQLESMHS